MPTKKIAYHEATPAFWAEHQGCMFGAPDAERLEHHTIDEYVVDTLGDAGCALRGLSVGVFRRMTPNARPYVEALLEDMLGDLDDEYGDPDDHSTKPTPGMLRAAEALVAAVEADYEAWACDHVATVEVDVQRWITEHQPDWLECDSPSCAAPVTVVASVGFGYFGYLCDACAARLVGADHLGAGGER